MGLADWDFDDTLRAALQETEHLKKIKDLAQSYNKTFETAQESNIKIKDKYKQLYNLEQ